VYSDTRYSKNTLLFSLISLHEDHNREFGMRHVDLFGQRISFAWALTVRDPLTPERHGNSLVAKGLLIVSAFETPVPSFEDQLV
jgi:hypothetical protein